eukprot:4466519-Amphidinium_carterae.1
MQARCPHNSPGVERVQTPPRRLPGRHQWPMPRHCDGPMLHPMSLACDDTKVPLPRLGLTPTELTAGLLCARDR